MMDIKSQIIKPALGLEDMRVVASAEGWNLMDVQSLGFFNKRNFRYRRVITITERSGSNWTDYQVPVELNSTNFNFSHTRFDGGDIRFTDTAGNLLPYWIESYDASAQTAKIFVKVPSLPANATIVIYMYYGNSEVDSASDGFSTFEVFDGFGKVDTQSTKILISNDAFGGDILNVASFITESLWTFNSYQYVTFIDSSGNIMVGKRALPNGEWTIVDTGYDVDTSDSHHAASLGIDPDGYIHISYGMHDDPLQYIRSDNPEDITSFSPASMTGLDENVVTYPTFFTDGNHLYFAYRNGASGNGELYLNKYDHNTKTWKVLQHPLINPPAASRNPYWDYIVIDSAGRFHISWCWRDSSDPITNHDICYAYSDDGGQTWKKSDGSLYSLPITYGDSEIIDPIPINSGLLNQNDLAVDIKNRPHIVYYKLDENGYENYYHAWFDGSSWHINKITHFSTIEWADLEANGYVYPMARPTIVVDGTKVIVLFRVGSAGYLYAALADEPYTSWCFVRFDEIWGWMEPKYDRQYWMQERYLYIVAQRTMGENPETIYLLETTLSSWSPKTENIIVIWQDYSTSLGSPKIENHELSIDTKADMERGIITFLNRTFSAPFIIEFEEYEVGYYVDPTNWMGIHFCKNRKNDWTLDSGHSFLLSHNSDYNLLVDGSIVINGSQSIVSPTSKHKVSVKVTNGRIKVDLNNTPLIDWTGSMTRDSGWIGIVGYGFHHHVDNFRVRKYADPEPLVSIGSENVRISFSSYPEGASIEVIK